MLKLIRIKQKSADAACGGCLQRRGAGPCAGLCSESCLEEEVWDSLLQTHAAPRAPTRPCVTNHARCSRLTSSLGMIMLTASSCDPLAIEHVPVQLGCRAQEQYLEIPQQDMTRTEAFIDRALRGLKQHRSRNASSPLRLAAQSSPRRRRLSSLFSA